MQYQKLKIKSKNRLKSIFAEGIERFYPVAKRLQLTSKKEEVQFTYLNKNVTI